MWTWSYAFSGMWVYEADPRIKGDLAIPSQGSQEGGQGGTYPWAPAFRGPHHQKIYRLNLENCEWLSRIRL